MWRAAWCFWLSAVHRIVPNLRPGWRLEHLVCCALFFWCVFVASAAWLANRCPACFLCFLGLQRKDGETPRPRVITGVRGQYQSHWCVSLQATGCAPGPPAHLSFASVLLITWVLLATARALSAQIASRALSGLSYGPRTWLCGQDSHALGSDGSAPGLTGWHPSRTTCLTYAEVWMRDGGHGHGHVRTLTQSDSSILNVGRKKRGQQIGLTPTAAAASCGPTHPATDARR